MKTTFKMLLEDEASLSRKEQTALIAEWETLSQKLEVLNALTKKMNERAEEIAASILPIAKASEAQQITIKSTISTFKTRKTTSVSYQKAFTKALEVVNEEQKKLLETYLESVTNKGVKEYLDMVCPKVARVTEKVKNASSEDALKKLAREILELEPEKVEEGLLSSAKEMLSKAFSWIKSHVSKLKQNLLGLKDAVSELQKVVNTSA